MNYTEGNLYRISHDYYNDIKLTCIWVEYSFVYFKLPNSTSIGADYKLELKTKKLYRWNDKCSGWDTVENTLSEYSADVWDRTGVHRQGDPSGYYSETGQN
jgi:hypothetical protein